MQMLSSRLLLRARRIRPVCVLFGSSASKFSACMKRDRSQSARVAPEAAGPAQLGFWQAPTHSSGRRRLEQRLRCVALRSLDRVVSAVVRARPARGATAAPPRNNQRQRALGGVEERGKKKKKFKFALDQTSGQESDSRSCERSRSENSGATSSKRRLFVQGVVQGNRRRRLVRPLGCYLIQG